MNNIDKNEYKVNNFNSLRKANIKFESNLIFAKSSGDNFRFDSNDLSNNPQFQRSSEFYRSAVGTKYDHAENNGIVQTRMDFPKNALHIPGIDLFSFKDISSLYNRSLKNITTKY